MRTSFHHQPEAQHPNFQLSTAGRPITPSFGSKADISQRLADDRDFMRTRPSVAVQKSASFLQRVRNADF